MLNREPLGNFREEPVTFVEISSVTKGVDCHVYTYDETSEKDLGIIFIDPGCKTPLQRVLSGKVTMEGYHSGKGVLTVIRQGEEVEVFDQEYFSEGGDPVEVFPGDIMQWEADLDSALVAYEVCFPPYADGRFENLAE